MSGFTRRLQQSVSVIASAPSSAFPTAATTGIAGVGLTTADLTASGSVVVSTNDIVLDKLYITGNVTFSGSPTGCIIKRCRIEVPGANTRAIDLRNTGGPVIIEDCELIYTLPPDQISGSTAAINCPAPYAHQILRCDISVFPHGIDVGAGPYLIQDNYLHDSVVYQGTQAQGPTHNDCIYMASSNGGQILHNSLLNPLPQTAAIINDVHAAGSGNFSGLTIDNNLMAGGGYTIYPVNDSTNPNNISFTNVHITNNVFSRLIGTSPGTQPYPAYYANGGNFGAKYPTGFSTYFADPSNVWSGNTWGDDGSTIP